MSAQDHLKQASIELLKAADMMKVEIDDLRRQEETSKRDIHNYIAQLLLQIQHNEHEIRRLDDPGVVSRLQSKIMMMQREVAEKRRELAQMQRDIETTIQQKSGMISGLQSQANSIKP